MKLVVKKDDDKVVGFHYLGPDAGEVTQGFAGMIALGATKENFDDLIGIHPTCAEGFTTLNITKSSGTDPTATGC
jgi:thioredoxin reductase (NADPH)